MKTQRYCSNTTCPCSNPPPDPPPAQPEPPIEVKVIREAGQTVAQAEELNEYGTGSNQTEALTDLQKAIADLYFTLEDEQERLGKAMQKTWDLLQSKVSKR